jgi:hypothetical protein
MTRKLTFKIVSPTQRAVLREQTQEYSIDKVHLLVVRNLAAEYLRGLGEALKAQGTTNTLILNLPTGAEVEVLEEVT